MPINEVCVFLDAKCPDVNKHKVGTRFRYAVLVRELFVFSSIVSTMF